MFPLAAYLEVDGETRIIIYVTYPDFGKIGGVLLQVNIGARLWDHGRVDDAGDGRIGNAGAMGGIDVVEFFLLFFFC